MRFRNKVTYISFILAILVISIHTYNVEVYGLADKGSLGADILTFIENFMNQLETVCVPFFFMLSGYLFFRNYSWDKVLTKYKSRFFSLVLPYIIWCTIYFLCYAVLTHVPQTAARMNMEPTELSIPFYLSCLWNSTYTVLWFVKHLILMIIPTPIYFLLFKVNGKWWSYVISIASFIVILLISWNIIPICIPYLSCYFVIGCYLGINGKKFIENPNRVMTIAGCILFLLLSVYLLLGYKVVIWWTIGMIASIWYALDIFKFSKKPKWWMKLSFFLYCGHSLLLEGLEKVWFMLGGTSVIAASIDYFLMPVLVAMILIVIARIMTKFTPCMWKILMGNR